MTRTPLMAGNWKMHNTHFEGLALVQKLAFSLTDKDFDAVDGAVLPPFTALRSVQTLVAGDRLRIVYGAQDISPHDKGAYTGDISGLMLAKLGCSYVLAGHSERRQYHGEDDALVNAKVKAALRAGLTPILCIGENLDVRRAGDQISHTLAQLDGGLGGLAPAHGAGSGGTPCRCLRAGLGDRHRRGGLAGGRTGGLRRDSGQAFGGSRGPRGSRCAYSVWRVSESRQRSLDHDAARYRRRAGWRREPRRR